MIDLEQPSDFHTYPSSLTGRPNKKTINEISNIEPHHTHEPIDIQNDEREAIEVFITRMNELDQATNGEYAFIQDASPERNSFEYQYGTPQMKQQILREDTPNNSPALNGTINEDDQFRILVGQKVKEMQFQLSALQIQKFQIIDQLITFKQEINAIVRNQAQHWDQLIEKHEEEKARYRQQYEQNLQQLQQAICRQKIKYQQLLHQKQQEKLEINHLGMHIQELQELNSKLNRQLEQLESQNNQLKYQLNANLEADAVIKQLQEEVRVLNRTLDQNSEYIFYLQQRVATQSLLLTEKEIALRKQMEIQLQQEREDIQRQYRTEFQNIRSDLQDKIRSQLKREYQDLEGLKQEYEKQLADLQNRYQQQNQILLHQNQQLRKQVEEYQLRLKQLNEKQSQSSTTQNQLAKKVDNLHLRLKQKEVQLNYYKERVEKLELTKAYPAKNNNIILIDQLNSSNSFATQSAVSPCSAGTTLLAAKQVGSSRDQMINTILSRIRMRQNYSILSNINDNNMSMEGQYKKGYTNSVIKPVSPQSMILQKQKDLRMKNISFKLQQLRSDIRRQIGMISN